jgi:hypothetical protein
VVDDVSVQFGAHADEHGESRVYLYFMREFSDPTAEGTEPLGQLVCEFVYPVGVLAKTSAGDFWTQDVRTLSEFIDQVEGAEGFQALMNARPIDSSVFLQEA